jgi:phenylacetate-coenzyme A ligase PaaK-like adenylate-forming protein
MTTYFPGDRLAELMRFVAGSEKSTFYKHLKSFERTPLSQDMWRTVPFITRHDVEKVAFHDRCFIAPDAVRFTSGTSGNPVLVSPRIYHGPFYDSIKDAYRLPRDAYFMNFMFPSLYGTPRFSNGIRTVSGYSGQLLESARIASALHITAFNVMPSTATPLIETLKAIGFDLDTITLIVLTGERCSDVHIQYVHTAVPKAEVLVCYGSSELREIIAFTCMHQRSKKEEHIIVPSPEFYFELIDPDTQNVIQDTNVTGELVITNLSTDVPLPLIRYRTGDIAQRVAISCGCSPDGFGYILGGRTSIFPIRITLGEISAPFIESALRAITGVQSEYYEAQFASVAKDGIVKPSVHFKIVAPVWHGSDEELASEIQRRLHVSATTTYEDGVQKGYYYPLTAERIAMPPAKSKAPVPKISRIN